MKTRIARLNSRREVLSSQPNDRDGVGRKLIIIIAMLMVIGFLVWRIG